MGLIADVVESVREAFTRVFDVVTSRQFLTGGLVASFHDDLFTAIDEQVASLPDQFQGPAGFAVARLRDMSLTSGPNPVAWAANMTGIWQTLINEVLDAVNEERPILDLPEGLDPALFELATFTTQSVRAGNKAITAFAVANVIIISVGAAASIVDAVPFIDIKSAVATVQNLIWATGIQQLASMAFTPQINASLAPLLLRRFNSTAMANIAPPTDLIRFQLREVFLKGRREELIGDDDLSTFIAFMQQHGFSKFWAESYWGAHWVLSSITQLNEMVHRGVIDEDEWARQVKFNDYLPSQIPRLQQIIYSPFTRVDARRMADLGVLDDRELLQAYADIGYFAPTDPGDGGLRRARLVENPDFTVHKAQALVVWTKMFNAIPDVRRRFRNGWIDQEQLLLELADTGLPAPKVERVFQTIVKREGPARIARERDLTRGLIASAYKEEIIGWRQAIFLLGRLHFSTAEAALILQVAIKSTVPDITPPTPLGDILVREYGSPEDGEPPEGEV